MSGSSDWILEFMTWLADEVEPHLPGAGSLVGDILYGEVPEADEDDLYLLAEAYGAAAELLANAYGELAKAADGIIENWTAGDPLQFPERWYQYLEGLRSTAESMGDLQEGVNAFALQVELMKFMVGINLMILAISLVIIIIALIPSGGTSAGGVPGVIGTAQAGIQAARALVTKAITSISIRAMLKALPTFVIREAVPTAARSALPVLVRTELPAVVRTSLPILVRTTLPNALRTALPALGRGSLSLLRNLPANLLRGILPRNVIARSVADRMATQAVRGMVGRSLLRSLEREAGATALTQRGRALIRQQLARELEEQLAGNFGARVAARSAESHVARLAAGELAQQVTRATLGREAAGMAANVSFRDELARYLGTRMVMGAGIMGGGNLLGQFLQVADGHRAPGAVDFGEAGLYAAQGVMFGAGMWGSPLGHVIGGGIAGGTFALGTETYDHFVEGEAFSWSDVAAGAGHGAAAGGVFGTLSHVQTSVRPLPLKIGQEVVAVPGEHGRIGMLAHDAGARTAVGIDVAGRGTFTARFGGEGFKPTEIVRMDAKGDVIVRLPGDTSTSHGGGDGGPPQSTRVPGSPVHGGPGTRVPEVLHPETHRPADGAAQPPRSGVTPSAHPEHGPPGGAPERPGGHPLASAGAEAGEPPTPRSIEQGTVRMEDHPNYPHVVQDLGDLGYSLVVRTTGDPHVVIRHVYDQSRQLAAVEHEVHVQRGMRYLDLEHELDHVRQMTDPRRFPDGPLPTEIVGKPKIIPPQLKNWQNAIVEYHVRLTEFIRLAERGVDPEILVKHMSGVDEWRGIYQKTGIDGGRASKQVAWTREHFPDIRDLEVRTNELRSGRGPEPGRPIALERGPASTNDDGGLLQKSAGAPSDGDGPPRPPGDGLPHLPEDGGAIPPQPSPDPAGPAPPHEAPHDPAPLASLEEPIGADVPVVDADQVSFRDVAPAQPAEPRALTPEWVRDTLAAPKMPEQIVRWVREHLMEPAEDGTMVPKSAVEIDATIARLQAEAAQAVAVRPASGPDAPSPAPDTPSAGEPGHDGGSRGPHSPAVGAVADRLGISDPTALEALDRAYHVAYEYSAPFIVDVAQRMLTDLRMDVAHNPETVVVFVGRDGHSLAVALERLDPDFFHSHGKEVVLSRALVESAVLDVEQNLEVGYPQLSDFRQAAGKVDPADIPGARARLTEYLQSRGIPVGEEGSKLVLIDTSYKGTVQELLAALYPETSFTGRYAFFGESPLDPHPGSKVGYAVNLRVPDSNSGRPVSTLLGDPALTFSHQDAIGSIEETLHGGLGSPRGFGSDSVPLQRPQHLEPDPLKGLNPAKVAPPFTDPLVREAVKDINLIAVLNFAEHIVAVRESGGDWLGELNHGSHRYRDQIRNWIANSGRADPVFVEVMDSFVRRADKAVVARLADLLQRSDRTPEQILDTWRRYDQLPTLDERKAFVDSLSADQP